MNKYKNNICYACEQYCHKAAGLLKDANISKKEIEEYFGTTYLSSWLQKALDNEARRRKAVDKIIKENPDNHGL